jgi:GDPmannose 4,6-dehydratase
MASRRALITGITGQDGSYLAEFLLARDYEVVGMVRRSSTEAFERIAHIQDQIVLDTADLIDEGSIVALLDRHRPHEVYNLAAQSYVRSSFDQPVLTGEVTGLGVVRLLDAIRIVDPDIRMYQASSSEMFGNAPSTPQSESTPFAPTSPYGAAKAYAHWAVVGYRQRYDLYAACGIAFNHESPRRGHEFLTRKISRAVASIASGSELPFKIGNLDARRDWGFAGDYVDAMWRILQRDEPDDYVVATGVAHSVRDLVDLAFSAAGLDWRDHVENDQSLHIPNDITELLGDPTKAGDQLDWRATTSLEDLVTTMVEADLAGTK